VSAPAPLPYHQGEYLNLVQDRWVRLERDLQSELDRFWPSEELDRVVGVRFTVSGGQTAYVKDIKFSNSITVEHNTLGGGAIGHIVRNRRVAPDTAVLTDTWFHYDQVGSVLSESDADGELVATHYQDAFGVRQADWETGLPGGVGEGWAHNTKEIDGGTGLMYMYQRHYIPEYGQFMSRAPYGPMMEEEYVFAASEPPRNIDPIGMDWSWWNPVSWPFGVARARYDTASCLRCIRQLTDLGVHLGEKLYTSMAVKREYDNLKASCAAICGDAACDVVDIADAARGAAEGRGSNSRSNRDLPRVSDAKVPRTRRRHPAHSY
jgi:RHS repeat-associated protein